MAKSDKKFKGVAKTKSKKAPIRQDKVLPKIKQPTCYAKPQSKPVLFNKEGKAVIPSPINKGKDIYGRWLPGYSPSPAGRPKGILSGRRKALSILDNILSKEDNQRVLFRALENELRKAPVKFFKEVVMPLIPKKSIEESDRADKAPIRLMFDYVPKPKELPGQVLDPQNQGAGQTERDSNE